MLVKDIPVGIGIRARMPTPEQVLDTTAKFTGPWVVEFTCEGCGVRTVAKYADAEMELIKRCKACRR